MSATPEPAPPDLPLAPERRYFLLFLGGLFFLLLWSAWDYGGRYLHIQTFSQVLSAGLTLMLGLQLLRRRDSQTLRGYPLLRPALLWLLALGMSWMVSVNRLASLEEIWRWVMYLLLALGVYGWLRLQPRPEAAAGLVIKGALLIGAGIAAVGFVMPSAESGLSSTFYRTNDLAGYLLLLVPLALQSLLRAETLVARLGYGAGFALLGVCLGLTNSRSSWAAGLLACGLVLLLERRQLPARSLRWLLPGLLGLSALGLLVAWPQIGTRLQTLLSLGILQENATRWRLELLEGAWRMFLDHPVLGTGPNTYASVLPAYQQMPGYYSINPHNFYLQALAETGLIGLGAFLIWVLGIGRGLLARPNRWSIGVFGGLMASLMHIGFDIDWSVAAIPMLFAVLLGAGLTPAAALPQAEPDAEAPGPDPRPAGVLIFACLGLALVPSLNYFSAQAYGQSQALEGKAPAASLAALQRAIALAPWPSGRHHYSLASQYLASDELEPALAAVTRAIQLDPHNARYYGLAAGILLRLDRKPAALAMLLRRQELNPYRHPHIYTEIGDFYLQHQQESKQALSWYLRGQSIFTHQTLSHYERYTPSDRYEAFTLNLKLAALREKLGETKAAVELRNQAQKLLRGATADLFVTAPPGPGVYATPVDAVLAYWAQVPEHYRNPSHTFDSVLPESLIEPPPPGRLDPERIQFVQAERELFAATLVYALPRRGSSTSWMLFEDRLVGEPTGWKIVSRRGSEP